MHGKHKRLSVAENVFHCRLLIMFASLVKNALLPAVIIFLLSAAAVCFKKDSIFHHTLFVFH